MSSQLPPFSRLRRTLGALVVASIVAIGSTTAPYAPALAASDHEYDGCGEPDLYVYDPATSKPYILQPGDGTPYIAFPPSDYMANRHGWQIPWHCGTTPPQSFGDYDFTYCPALFGAAFQVVRRHGDREFDIYCLDKQSALAHGVVPPSQDGSLGVTSAAAVQATSAPTAAPMLREIAPLVAPLGSPKPSLLGPAGPVRPRAVGPGLARLDPASLKWSLAALRGAPRSVDPAAFLVWGTGFDATTQIVLDGRYQATIGTRDLQAVQQLLHVRLPDAVAQRVGTFTYSVTAHDASNNLDSAPLRLTVEIDP